LSPDDAEAGQGLIPFSDTITLRDGHTPS
jgi:hypothetical protein